MAMSWLRFFILLQPFHYSTVGSDTRRSQPFLLGNKLGAKLGISSEELRSFEAGLKQIAQHLHIDGWSHHDMCDSVVRKNKCVLRRVCRSGNEPFVVWLFNQHVSVK